MQKKYNVNKALEIDAPAELCYSIICDIKSYPLWFKHIKEIIIKDEFEDGRPARAFYIFDVAIKKNLKIIWEYEYLDSSYKLTCTSMGGDLVNTRAVYEFRELHSGKTLLNFRVNADFGIVIPVKILNYIIDVIMKDFLVMIKRECERKALEFK